MEYGKIVSIKRYRCAFIRRVLRRHSVRIPPLTPFSKTLDNAGSLGKIDTSDE